MTALPEWLAAAGGARDWGVPADGLPEGRHGAAPASLARRALNSLTRVLGGVLGAETLASRAGLLQGLDARAKLLGLLGLVVVATLLQSLAGLAAGYAVCLALAAASRVPAKRLAAVWLAVPLFSAAALLPATLNLISGGEPVWTLWRGPLGPWHLPDGLAVTDAGLLVASRMVLRTGVCVSLALLLTATTRPQRLLRGLRMLGLPQVFVMVLLMMERYLAVLVRAAEEIHLAKLSRSIAPGSLRQEHAWVASGVGSLYRRTQSLGEEVYLAMIARGYAGDVHLLEEPRWRAADWVFLAAMAGTGAVLLLLG